MHGKYIRAGLLAAALPFLLATGFAAEAAEQPSGSKAAPQREGMDAAASEVAAMRTADRVDMSPGYEGPMPAAAETAAKGVRMKLPAAEAGSAQ
jgi:hypothetical protein